MEEEALHDPAIATWKHSLVKGLEFAEPKEGGAGVTVVEMALG